MLFVTDAPTNVSAVALTPRSVEVTWEAPSPVSNVTSYLITYNSTASYASNGSLAVDGFDNTSGILTDLEESTLYIITVRAITDTEDSGESEEVTVTTYTDGK